MPPTEAAQNLAGTCSEGAHASAIVDCRVLRPQTAGLPGRVSTAGWDGRVSVWEVGPPAGYVPQVSDKISALRLTSQS